MPKSPDERREEIARLRRLNKRRNVRPSPDTQDARDRAQARRQAEARAQGRRKLNAKLAALEGPTPSGAEPASYLGPRPNPYRLTGRDLAEAKARAVERAYA